MSSAEDETGLHPRPLIEWRDCHELGYENGGGEHDYDSTVNQIGSSTKSVCFACGSREEEEEEEEEKEYEEKNEDENENDENDENENDENDENDENKKKHETKNLAKRTKLSKCSKCHVASYCSRECQVKDWKKGSRHKMACANYRRVGMTMTLKTTKDREEARTEVFSRIRFYACPYAVHRSNVLGPGFLFVQSPSTLAELSLTYPQDIYGHPMTTRSILIHFLTMAEYDTEVCRDDFEMAIVRSALRSAVEGYNSHESVVLLMRFRCGHVAIGISKLVPDYSVCRSLGRDYYSETNAGALQLNLDDA